MSETTVQTEAPRQNAAPAASAATASYATQATSPAQNRLAHPPSSSLAITVIPQQHQQYGPVFPGQMDVGSRGGNPYHVGAMANALPPTMYNTNRYPPQQQRYGAQGLQYYYNPSMGPSPYGSSNVTFHPNGVAMASQQPLPTAWPTYPFVQGLYPTPAHQPAPMMPVQYPPMVSGAMPHANTKRLSSLSDAPVRAGLRSHLVRGPPRKPKQSGHAIWIGNLPPQTGLMALVHHVCSEAAGLESLFLISKSNCAFANYKDEATCNAAQQKLHESKFQGVRLVSRLRKNTVEGAQGVSVPTGPAADGVGNANARLANEHAGVDGDSSPPNKMAREAPPVSCPNSGKNRIATPAPRYFILKSLTTEDLRLSVKTGIWATQTHNEKHLNTAFETADNVYLIFSANKSGEYFGYARMTSKVNDDPAAAIEFAPSSTKAALHNQQDEAGLSGREDVELPTATVTEATESTPRGRIIDDSARGTIFWEAESSIAGCVNDTTDAGHGAFSAEEGETNGTTNKNGNKYAAAVGEDDGAQGEENGSAQSNHTMTATDAGSSSAGEERLWGKPFQLKWLSLTRVPFYRTRGLRNPLNANREIKIARDGTELDAATGKKLLGMFKQHVQQETEATQQPVIPIVPPMHLMPTTTMTPVVIGEPRGLPMVAGHPPPVPGFSPAPVSADTLPIS